MAQGRWLNRNLACAVPALKLCLSEAAFKAADVTTTYPWLT
jgi:hypothetical protein